MTSTAKKLLVRSKTLATLLLLAAAGSARAQQGAPTTVWSLRIDSPGGLISVYQPQPEKLEGNTLTARAAVSLLAPGATDPEFGAMWFSSQVITDRDTRTVTMQNMTVKQMKLPNSNPDQEKQFGDAVTATLPTLAVTFSLDQLESTLGVVEKAREESKLLETTPPKIVFSQTPTTLVVIDGQPKLQAGQTAGVLRVVNTPFIMMLDQQNHQYYLKAGSYWMAAGDIGAAWAVTGAVPAEVAAEANIMSPPQPADPNAPQAAPAAPAGPTAIMVAYEPTELICTDGAPTYTPLPGNNLLYLSNTTSDVFMEVSTNNYYVLLSGRWYTGRSLNGPWTYLDSKNLPPEFAQIPTNSPKANVLVSVANTPMARDARLDCYVPQTTAIARNSGAALTISYDGEPAFVPVENSPIQYASNCADPVLLVDNGYYCCHQAVWYQAASPVGPWVVSTVVPQVIYTLPPSCPVYNCRYVYVYDSNPDVVYCGYLPGYTGCYVYGSTVVYGTGYYYHGWYGHEYIPRPYTYGFAPRYDYYTSSWGYGATARYDRSWFVETPVRHDWFGPAGYVDYHRDLEHRPEVVNRTVVENHTTVVNNFSRVNIYNRTDNVKRNVVINKTVVNNNDRTKVINDNTKVENNVYAGHDGQVYRRTDSGWESHDGKGWTATKTVPEARPVEPEHVAPVKEAPHEVPAHEVPAHEVPAHDVPAREVPHEVPAREVPHEVPAREVPHEAPARETPPGGLEDDHAARERGNVRSNPAPVEHAAPVEHGAPAGPEHGGGGGGDEKNHK